MESGVICTDWIFEKGTIFFGHHEFNLILDAVIKKPNLKGDPSLKLKQIVAYAVDVALVARSLKALKEIFRKLKNEATQVGLSINEDKTKYMKIKRTGVKDITHLKIYNFAF